jgi:hypothetical protein
MACRIASLAPAELMRTVICPAESGATSSARMALIFSHMRLDLGQFPYLMPQRLRVVARELRAATPTFAWLERFHFLAVFRRDQGSLVLFVAWLSATLLVRPPSWRLRSGMGMLGAGRQRRVLRRLPSAFQFRNSPQQQFHERPHRRRHLGIEFRRNLVRIGSGRRHGACRRRNRRSCPDQFLREIVSGVSTVTNNTLVLANSCPREVQERLIGKVAGSCLSFRHDDGLKCQ